MNDERNRKENKAVLVTTSLFYANSRKICRPLTTFDFFDVNDLIE